MKDFFDKDVLGEWAESNGELKSVKNVDSVTPQNSSFNDICIDDYVIFRSILDDSLKSCEKEVEAISKKIEACYFQIDKFKDEISDLKEKIKLFQKRKKTVLKAISKEVEIPLSKEEILKIKLAKNNSKIGQKPFKIIYKEKEYDVCDEFLIGRDISCNLVLADDTVSRVHAKIYRGELETFYIEDCGSKNGVFVNGNKVEEGGMELPSKSIIVIGQCKMTFVEGKAQIVQSIVDGKQNPTNLIIAGKKIALKEKLTIGRSSSCDIVIDNKSISRVHASIQKLQGFYCLKDEQSTNGTFLNGHRVPDGNYLKIFVGDEIILGSFLINVN